MKILVLLTGGTIGSSVSGGVISADEGTSSLLTQLYCQRYGRHHVFTVKRIMNTLSENLGKNTLSEMLSAVLSENLSGYDGLIITHGTDSLAFSAPLAAFVLRKLPCPIAVVSANYPLEDKRSNGVYNFASAVALLGSGEAENGQVYVPWRNAKGENIIHLASRVRRADCYSDDVSSFGSEPFGEVKNGIFIRNKYMKELPKDDFDFSLNSFNIKNSVLVLSAYPTFDYSLIDFSEKNRPCAVLQCLYHSATACTVGESESACEFILRCKKKGIPVYGCSFKYTSGEFYETGVKLLESGLIPLKNISEEAAFAKLTFAYNCGYENVEEIIDKNLCSEILPRP